MAPRRTGWYRTIHKRLLSGDPTAPSELVEAIFHPLRHSLATRNPGIDDETLLDDAAADALLDYIKTPERFDAEKAGLFSYLKMAAQGDLKNVLAKQRRRRKRETFLEAVEVEALGGKKQTEGTDNLSRLQVQRIRQQIVKHFDDPKDRQMVDLVIDGERSTEAFSEILGIQSMPVDEQRRQVKRHKDRLKKRLKKLGERIREEER